MRAPELGEIFAETYRVDEPLGRGGFATVYAAQELTSDRRVALKLIEPDDGDDYDPQTRARFEREVSILAKLRSPHTVRLLDHGTTAEGRLFAVFELIDGADLVDVLARRGRLTPGQVEHIARQLLESLAEAHAAGLVHRDIKPANIRVFERDGDPLTVKLLDFGIARSTDTGQQSVTRTGELIGTPRYMSPEQITAKPLTPASDLYSLGMVMVELLGGGDALAGNRLMDQLDRLHGGHEFTVPGLAVEADALMAVIKRMTARDPSQRVQSATAVIAALDRRAPEPRPTPPADNISPRRLRTRGLAFGVIVALLMGVWISQRREDEKAPVRHTTRANDLVKTAVQPADNVDVGRAPVDAASPAPSVASGCGKDSRLGPGGAFDGMIMHLPSDYDRNFRHPLVVLLHTDGQPASALRRQTGMAAIADRERFIVSTPGDGEPTPWGEKVLINSWRDASDADRILDIVERTAAAFCVDRDRVFIVGNGSGGYLAAKLSCEPWVTAVAINGHSYPATDQPFGCTSPKPALWLAAEDELTEEGHRRCAPDLSSIAEIEHDWIERNHCTGEVKVVDGGTCRTWDCEASFESCILPGGHAWPSDDPLLACVNAPPGPFDAGDKVWEFFTHARSPAPSR